MFDLWKENLLLRVGAVITAWIIAALIMFVFFPGKVTGIWMWLTLGGFLVAGIALVVNPILDDMGA